jgi:hypothetical protein
VLTIHWFLEMLFMLFSRVFWNAWISKLKLLIRLFIMRLRVSCYCYTVLGKRSKKWSKIVGGPLRTSQNGLTWLCDQARINMEFSTRTLLQVNKNSTLTPMESKVTSMPQSWLRINWMKLSLQLWKLRLVRVSRILIEDK